MTAVLKVLLFLLKCIGILLLVILGLLLVTVLLVLLAPVRYRGKLDKKEVPEEIFRADGLISWLNPFLRVRIRYTEKKLHYTVRIFGLCLLNSDKPKKEKKRKKKEKTKKVKKRKKTSGGETTGNATPETATEQEVSGDETMLSAEPATVTVPATDGEEPQQVSAQENDGVGSQEESVPENQEDSEAGKKPSLFSKIKKLYEKVKAIPAKIKQKVTKLINTGKLLWYKKEKVVAFFEDERHKVALGTAWDTVKQVLRHVLPGKIKGHVEFGTGDPASTGKALGMLGVVYAWYGKGITVVPDFYEKRVVAELRFKGRIRGGTLLVKGIRLLRDKNVKRFRKNFKKLLTVLKQKAE